MLDILLVLAALPFAAFSIICIGAICMGIAVMVYDNLLDVVMFIISLCIVALVLGVKLQIIT